MSNPRSKNPIVTPDATAPAYVDYIVSGESNDSECEDIPYFDEVRVFFYPEPVVSVGPEPAIICPGGSGVQLTGTVTGGDQATGFDYFWYGPDGSEVGRGISHNATTTGTYKFAVVPKKSQDCKEFSASVNVVTNLTANAGEDQLACASGTVQLSGEVTAALGGHWTTSGSGTFSNADDLNAVYTPSVADVNAGSVRLRLTSTGNGNCSPVSDEVLITFYNMEVELEGTPVICNGTLGTITANVTGAQGTVRYQWSNGATTATINNLSAGTYTVTVTDEKGCGITQSFTVTQVTGPTDFAADTANETCGRSDGSITVKTPAGGTPNYTYSIDGQNFQVSNIFAGLAANDYVVTIKDANGCTFSKSFTLTDIPGPTAVTASSAPASCHNNDGSITAGEVSGGTGTMEYSINGRDFQTSTTFTGLATGDYTLTARDINGCTISTSVTVEQQTLTAFTATPVASTCGNPNGTVTISNVVGGVGELQYSKDGSNYQDSPTLTGFTADTHTVWVRDERGCAISREVTITNTPGPTDFAVDLEATTCGDSNGEIRVTGVTSSGNRTFMYSINGVDFQTGNIFTGLAAGIAYTITVKDANGCTFSKSFTLTNVAGPTAVTASALPASCHNNDGTITAGEVTGGTGTKQYSINGRDFQNELAFTGLASGNYTLTARDVNGCIVTTSVTVVQQSLTNFTATPAASTCGNSNGTVTISGVVGGVGTPEYSKDGQTYQSSPTLTGFAAGTHTVWVRDEKGCAISREVTITNTPGPTDFAVELKATTCGSSNGEIRVTGVTTEGNRSFTYSLNGSTFGTGSTFTGLTAGTAYAVRVRDANGCIITKSFTLTNVPGPTAVTASSAPASCHNNDGTITAGAVSGGTGAMQYSINGRDFQNELAFTGLASGNYTLTARDINGCTITTPVTVEQRTLTNFTATPVASTCGNPNGTVTISGVVGGVGTPEYSKDGQTYQSSPTLTGFAAGTHTVWVRDEKGCTFSKQVTITNTPGPTDFNVELKATTCGNANGEIQVTGVTTEGNRTYEYAINGGAFQTGNTFTGLAAGVAYTITVKDANDCTFSKSFTLTNVEGPSAVTATAAAASCHNNDGTITVGGVTGGTGTIRYSLNNGTYQTGTIFTGLAAGTYTLTARDDKFCTVSTSVTVVQTVPTNFTATPTAATCGNANGTVVVSGIEGGIGTYTYSKDGQNFQESATLTGLAEGPHTITIKDARGCTFSKEVIIENIPGPSDFAFTANASSCGRSNGSIEVGEVTGGSGTYAYSINGGAFQASNTFANLRANTYRITVKDGKNCEFTKEVTVTDVAGPTNFAATVSNTTCGAANGEISVTGVTGTAGGYRYSRDGVNFQDSPDFTGLAVGEHVITVRDANGCTFSRTFTIINVPGPATMTVAQLAASCNNNDGRITVSNVSGGTGTYTYSINGRDFQTSNVFNGLAAGPYTVTVMDENDCTITRSITVGTNVPTTFAFTTKSSTCGNSNGTITVGTVTGGTGPYKYSKDGQNFSDDNTLTGFSAATHTIWVRDSKGCVVSRQIAVSNIAGPTDIEATATASSCGSPNGSLTVTGVTGNTETYTYSIDGVNFQESATFSNLLADDYTITVKDENGCTFAKDFTVTDVAGPSFVAEAESSTCGDSNGQIVVSNVTGGTGTYQYSLNNGSFQNSNSFANLAAGEYIVSVRDGKGCVATQTIEVTNIPGPTDITLAAVSSTCGNSNGSITVSAVTGGTSDYTYSLNGGAFQESATFAGLTARTYAITVKDARGCTFTKEVAVDNIAGPDGLTAEMTASTCGAANGELRITRVSGGTEGYTYSRNGVNFQESDLFTGLAAGEYTITVKDARGCTFAQKFNVTNTGGPTAVTATTQAASCQNNDGSVTVGTATGGTGTYTYSIDGTNFQESKNFTGLASGDYIVTAKDGNDCTVTTTVKVNTNVPTNFASTSVSSTCGDSNGSITVGTVTGGTGTYEYSKDGENFSTNATLTGFAAGSHTIWVRDSKGCVFSKSVSVSNIAGPEFTATPAATTCGAANGRITISGVTGGVGPYTYSIDGPNFQNGLVFENVLAGTYEVLVKDQNGCVGSVTVEVEDIAGPSDFELTAAASTCGDSNASITVGEVTGGTAPFAYSIDGRNFQTGTSFAALAAGEYTITVRDDNDCEFAKTITIENIPGPTDITLATESSTCGSANGTISVTGVTGGTSSYTYALNGGDFQEGTTFGNVLAGRYTVTVKDDNGCTFSKEIVVDNIAGPTNLTAEATASTCGAANGEIRVTGVTGGTSDYTYSRDGVNFQESNLFAGLAAGNYNIRVKDANGCIVSKQITVTNIGGPTAVAATFAPASCNDNDGSITAGTVTGGVAPYQYSINGSDFQSETTFGALASGEYTLTVKDANGCTVTTRVTVTNDVPATFASTTTSTTCGSNNGTITVGEVTGGFAPYTYSKDGMNFQESATLTGFVAGTHAITVKDAKGCTVTRQVQVSDIAGPSELAITVTASTCGDSNGQFTIGEVTGGTSPYTYSIDGTNFQSGTTFAGLAARTYEVTVKDKNGCTYTQSVTIENIPGPSDFVVTLKSSSCGRANGTVTVGEVTEGTAPYTYSKDGVNFQESASLTGLLAGEHTITVKDDNGCIVAKVVTIEDVPGPSDMILASTSSTCGSANGTISVTGVTGEAGGYTYSIDGSNFQEGTTFENVLAGNYTVTVKDANGCIYSEEIVVDNIAGPTNLTVSMTASTCGAANGELTVTNVSGGTESYSYAIDGRNFQASPTFRGLLAGEYTITVKDDNGCTFSKAFTVSDIAGPSTVVASAQAATCADNDGRITAGTVTGGTAPYEYSLNGGSFQSGNSFTGLASGEYTLTVRDAKGCETTTTVKVDKDGPGSFVASTNSSTCGSDNGSIRITSVDGGAAPYTYSLNGGAFQSGSSFSGLVAGEYTVTVKDANDCTHTETITINDVTGPTDLTASAQNTTCGNSNGQISVSNVDGGTAPYTYSINGTNFQTSDRFTALAAGEYLVTVKDANGCIFAKAVTVTNTDGPEGFATTVKASTCGASNGSVTIGAVTGGRAPYTYSKDGTNFQPSAELTGMAAGNHTVYIKDANGCTFSKAVVIENIAGPSGFELASTTATCGEANGSITASGVTGGKAPYTYSLNDGDFQSESVFASVAAGEHTITVKDANGCTIEKKVEVGNVAGPSALTASTIAASCDANDGAITVSKVTGGVAPYTYSINGSAFQGAAAFAGLAPGEYEVTVQDANGCSAVTTVTVAQKGPKEATLTANKAACGETNGSITVTAVDGGTAPYTYSLNGGSFQASATFGNLTAGTYTITIKDAEGCAITVEQAVQSSGGIESFTATGTDASCGERNGRIAISEIVGGTAPYTYSIDGNNFVAEPNFTGLAEGEYQIMVKDASGCTQVQTVTLQNSPMLTDVKFSVSAAACGNAAGEVKVTEVLGGTAPYTYSLDGTKFSASTTLANIAAGSYTLTVKDAKGCTFSVPVTVAGLSSKVANVSHISCFGDKNGTILIEATGSEANTEYSVDNGKTFQKNPEFTGLAKGTYQVITRFSSTCTITLGAVEIKEPAALQVEMAVTDGMPGKPNSGSAKVSAISGGTAPYVYSLNGGEFVNESEFLNLRGGKHYLKVRDASGCFTEVEFDVTILGELDIPNGFTPNGDGINDTWVIRNLPEAFPNCRVTIYNRWGSPVFESRGYGKEWDGTNNGKRLPDGTYYAIIEFGDDTPAVKTSVTIMR
ncbi:T9SS type B sorting domain-containing protein [Pontibacter lucknowensis]|uniref:T9SS type B sorting domain-containing protein n=1 Tax=Pontibacter lucknowensis TaxID=1077936 RepID=UPI00135670A9|nr:gliding motility-associated C-terminal domain-containing protein [Pontibacter lucknowensis]